MSREKEIKKIESRPKDIITNASWSALNIICAIAVSVFTTPVLIHSLGVSQYGIFLLIGSFTGILIVMNFGLGEATLRYVAYYHADRDLAGVSRVFGSTLSFYILLSLIVSTVLLATAPSIVVWFNIHPDQYQLVGRLVRLVALVYVVRVITRPFSVIAPALERYDISTKIGIGENLVRTSGYIGLALTGFGLIHLVAWDLAISVVAFVVWMASARKLLPGARLAPSLSFLGLREISGYSAYSFLTSLLNVSWRESGKLIVGAHIGASGVGYLGPGENIAVRIFSVVIAGTETLLPRFSANRDARMGQGLLLKATWASAGISTAVLVPLAVLMPPLLGLWINNDFTRESAVAGQCVALSLVGPAAFAPMAAFLRGNGHPGLVTAAMAAVGTMFVASSSMLVPLYGISGVGYAHLFSSVLWVVATVYCWKYSFGRRSTAPLLRVLGVPVLVGSLGFLAEGTVLRWWLPASWFSLVCCGVLFVSVIAVSIYGIDWLLGGDAPSRSLFAQFRKSKQFVGVRNFLAPRVVRY